MTRGECLDDVHREEGNEERWLFQEITEGVSCVSMYPKREGPNRILGGRKL